MAASKAQPVISIRELTELHEFQEAVRLQVEIWGFAEVDCLPCRLFVVTKKIGGQAFGAFDGERMIGFCVALPGVKTTGEAYLHSNMLGVLEAYRNAGVGRMLKLAQRDDALARGIRLMEWTFDPLELKNAYFNLERLGAVVQRYVLNQYGITTSDLHGGLPTDRCVAAWFMDSPRVRSLLAGSPDSRPPIEARIPVPADIASVKKSDPARAREIQAQVSARFVECFREGLTVVGLERSPDAGVYLLGRWQP